jgi:predicted MFS family arabinose efflux permease
VQGLSDLAMNVAGALGGVIAGLIVTFGSYTLLCLVALVPVGGLAWWTRRSALRVPDAHQ